MKKLMIGLFMLVSVGAMAQQSDVEATLATMKGQIEKGKGIRVNDRVVYTSGNEQFVLPIMQRWMKDTLSSVRSNAVVITGRLASFAKLGQPRTQAMDMLFKACEDKDPSMGSQAASYLKQVKWKYFTNTHKTAIGLLIYQGQPLLTDYLYLAGYMYATDQMSKIEGLVSSGKLNRKQLWQAHLALARMGNNQSMKECLKIADANPLGNDYIKVIVPGIIYTRQKTCIDMLVNMLKNKEDACTSPNPNYSGKIPCRYRIVEVLASVIADFPVKVTSEGDLVTNDYEGALQTSIKWFNEHKDYKFIDN
jgi:hypothetical protein